MKDVQTTQLAKQGSIAQGGGWGSASDTCQRQRDASPPRLIGGEQTKIPK
ncbi:hypothetical protein MIS45_09690 [Wielerella bovis]|nr:hypothetical protein [Wielerella bovis]ULJ69015.1 hypothetical protein MIS45_09690 [Wielerella bovis]